MLKALFFDLDGTLCHFQGNFKKIFIDCCSPIFNSHSHTYDLILNHWNEFLSQEGSLTAGIALKKICSELGISLPANYLEIAAHFCQTYANHITPILGVNDMIKTLSERYKLALISNGPMDMQCAAIKSLGIGNFFNTILISGDPAVLFRKPNPLIFQIALDRTETKSCEALMIGDNLKVDIEGAENLGLNTLFIGKNKDPRIRSIEDLPYLMNILETDFNHSIKD
ncbi:MAG: HAD family hydrolase [Parachlamydiaceae bacterium]|nr:HAD family hydrolase [Parachlamydiaceae bacterium]